MAALDRQNPNLDDFVGLNWSCWVDRVNILSTQVNVEDSSKYGRNCETMTLRKEDMHTFGHCPAHDELYLVVCSHCGHVVKPQAFEKHYERRHGPLTKTCGQSSTLAPQQRPRPARPTSKHSSSRERQKDNKCHEAGNSAASPVHQHRPSKAHKEAVGFPSVEKFPQENASLPHRSSSSSSSSSSPHPRIPPCHSGPLPPGHSSSSPSQRPMVQKPPAVQSSGSNSPLRGTRTYSRIYKNITKKECELNKQCGGLVPERKKLCSRELTYNTDSIHQQQKALGRTKTFDQLAEEQKTASAGHDMEQLLVKSKDKEQHLEPFEEKITVQSSKSFIGNSHNLRSGDSLESTPEDEGNHAVEVEEIPQYPLKQSLLSGEESEDDEQDEATDLPATAWHPKPLGLCTFGCRALGCSIFTFNRRLHHLRFALSTMLERHVSTHLWKKIPQVPSGLRSCHVTPPAVGSPVRTGVKPLKSTGSLSLESTSLGQSKTSQYNSHSIKPLSSTTSARLVPVRRRNPARLRKEEAQMAAKLTHGGEDKSSKYIRDPPLSEKGQPHIPSSQGPVNGSFSHGKKPCPPLHSSPCSRVRPPGIQQEVVSYDHRGLAQKRKGSNESMLISSSLSKCQRLSSPSQRGERISGMCKTWAWKKHPSPKDQ